MSKERQYCSLFAKVHIATVLQPSQMCSDKKTKAGGGGGECGGLPPDLCVMAEKERAVPSGLFHIKTSLTSSVPCLYKKATDNFGI